MIFASPWRGLGLLAAVPQATAPVGPWEPNPDRGRCAPPGRSLRVWGRGWRRRAPSPAMAREGTDHRPIGHMPPPMLGDLGAAPSCTGSRNGFVGSREMVSQSDVAISEARLRAHLPAKDRGRRARRATRRSHGGCSRGGQGRLGVEAHPRPRSASLDPSAQGRLPRLPRTIDDRHPRARRASLTTESACRGRGLVASPPLVCAFGRYGNAHFAAGQMRLLTST